MGENAPRRTYAIATSFSSAKVKRTFNDLVCARHKIEAEWIRLLINETGAAAEIARQDDASSARQPKRACVTPLAYAA
jgi:ABC-type uncharacterized transport system fused permease/ATPase subunit